MKVDLVKPKRSSFGSAGKDLRDIMFKIMENQNILKLLKYDTMDALEKPDLGPEEKRSMIDYNIRVKPKLPMPEEAGSFLIILFDTFVPNPTNPEFRDNVIIFDVICNVDNWLMDDYSLRPYRIMHEIDQMFNNQKLNGIGKVEFVTANSLILSSQLAGFTLMYRVINDV